MMDFQTGICKFVRFELPLNRFLITNEIKQFNVIELLKRMNDSFNDGGSFIKAKSRFFREILRLKLVYNQYLATGIVAAAWACLV